MKKSVLLWMVGLFYAVVPAMADVTFTVNVPSGTKQCYIVGALPQLSNWSAGAAVPMNKVENQDQFTVTIAGITADDVKASQGYKYICGPDWKYVEVTANGGEKSNRKTYDNPDTVAKWRNTYNPIGTVENYTINGKTYAVQILLPTNYDKSQKYPVTYLFGRHMRYRDAGSDTEMGDRILYADSWNVAGAVATMESEGQNPGIMVVIYAQLPEFTPWKNEEYMGTGAADKFLASVVNDFIPAVETKYPAAATNRTIMGADVAGLFAYYAAVNYPNTFGSCGLFAPSFWYNKENLANYMVNLTPSATNTKFVFTSAKNDMEYVKEDNATFINYLKEAGYTDIKTLNSASGMHDDKTWGSQFPVVFKYLKGISQDASLTDVQDRSIGVENRATTDATQTTWTFMKGEGTKTLSCTNYTTSLGTFYKGGITPVRAQLLVVEIPVDNKEYAYYWNMNNASNCSGSLLTESPTDIGFKTSRKTTAWQRVAIFEDGSYTQGAASKDYFRANGTIMTAGSNFEVSTNLTFGDDKTVSIYYGSVNSGSNQKELASASVSDKCIKATVVYSYLTNQITITETAWGASGIDLAYFMGEPAVIRVGGTTTVKVKIANKNGFEVSYRMNHNNASSSNITMTKGIDGEEYYTISNAQSGIYGFYIDITKNGETTKTHKAVYVKVLEGKESESSLILNPYKDIDWNSINQYKSNFHTHTLQSNDPSDNFTTHYVVDRYHQAGYKILSLTDHDYCTYPWTMFSQFTPGYQNRDPEQLGMLAVPGNELSKDNTNSWDERTGGNFNHHNDFFTGRQGQEFASLQESYAYTYALGGMQIINHPGQYWSLDKSYSETEKNGPGWHATNFKTYPSLVGLEVYNQGDRRNNDRILWDQILDRTMPNKAVFGYSGDDTHNDGQLFRNYNYMLMPELSTPALKTAMINGNSYFCYEPKGSGEGKAPRITSIVVDEANKTITIQANGQVTWIYSTDKTSSANTSRRSTVIGHGNTFSYDGYQGIYVRALITNVFGETCTQPFGFSNVISSIDEINSNQAPLTMVLYPNPTTSKVSVFMNELEQESTISVYDLNGKNVLNQTVDGAITELATENLANGMYIARCGNRTGKFIKK